MAYHDELLEQAVELVHKDPQNPKQASLRRAVSTAYHAVFHLLISESTSNWNQQHLRASLGRAFDHHLMKAACNRIFDKKINPFTNEDPVKVAILQEIALALIQLQEQRHIADYDNTTTWLASEASPQVKLAQKTSERLRQIRKEAITEVFLVSLLIKTRN